MKLYDGKKMVNIEMNNWTDNGYTPDWSIDFFEAGSLEYNEDMEAYLVEDVDYCIEQAMDWKNADGDFYEPDADTTDRNVDVTEIEVSKSTYKTLFKLDGTLENVTEINEAITKLTGETAPFFDEDTTEWKAWVEYKDGKTLVLMEEI